MNPSSPVPDQAEPVTRPSTPVPSSPVRLSPPPPPGAPRKPVSTTLRTGLTRSGQLVTQLPDGRWCPAPEMPLPEASVPPGDGEDSTPPQPQFVEVRICNCDSDGECRECQEERWNTYEDARTGCATCAGCSYCQSGAGYEGTDEI
jgi:hypothetical protein